MRPHENILSVFHNERCLLDKGSFKREKGLINECRVPILCRLIKDKVTNFSHTVLSLGRGEDLITILPYYPVIFPYISGLAVTNLPTTSFFYKINSLEYALPRIAAASALMSMKNIRIRIVSSF
jgi:hypothetical protein